MRCARTIALWLVTLSWPAPAFAYRPFDSTDADVAKAGELEFEIGPAGYLQENHERFLVAPALIVNAGIVDRWELVLEGQNRILVDRAPGEPRLEVGDAALSVKGLLREGSLQDQLGPSVATEIGALLPTTEAEPGVGASIALILSERWRVGAAHLNAGVLLSRNHREGAFAGLIIEGPVAWPLRPVAEAFVEREIDVTAIESGLLGVIWPARDKLSFDAAVRAGRAFDARLVEARAGLTWAFDL